MTFTIYASDLEKVQKRLDKLAVKAAGYSIPFAYHVGAEHPETVRVYDVDHVNHVQYAVNRYKVAAVDVTVDCEELIKANGWTLRAKVEHPPIPPGSRRPPAATTARPTAAAP